jgi:hypothetical protein
MSPIDASQGYRYQMDQSLAIVSINSVASYQVWLIQTTNNNVSFSDTNSATTVRTRITVGASPGYSIYAPNDGYTNPMIEQPDDAQTITIANGQLTANRLLMGPLVFPYTYNNASGGWDPLLTFQPPRGAAKHVESVVQILGEGLATTGNYFKVKSIVLKQSLFTLSYQVELIAAGING